jgi:hypothetical protein
MLILFHISPLTRFHLIKKLSPCSLEPPSFNIDSDDDDYDIEDDVVTDERPPEFSTETQRACSSAFSVLLCIVLSYHTRGESLVHPLNHTLFFLNYNNLLFDDST